MNLQLYRLDVYQRVMELAIASILRFVVYFIGGYFLYSSFYAAIGAAVDNQTDSQQFLTYYYAAGFECLCRFF
jgi:ABC-type Na+ efflux pump permease subunit